MKYVCEFGHESMEKPCKICDLFKSTKSLKSLKKNINFFRPGWKNIFTKDRKFFKVLRFGFRKETMYFVMEQQCKFYIVELTITGVFSITNADMPFKTVYAANKALKDNT